MISSFTTRFRSLIWFVIFTFTLYSLPHFGLILPFKIHLDFSEATAAEVQDTETQTAEALPSSSPEATPGDDSSNTPPRRI
jgi:hypothetical protein